MPLVPVQPRIRAGAPSCLDRCGPIPSGVHRGGNDGDVRVPAGKLVGQKTVAAHHQVAGPGQIAGAVAAGIEPNRVIHVQDHGPLGHGLERGKGGQQLAGDPGHVGLPGAGESCGARRRCRRHPQRAEGDGPGQNVSPGQGVLAHFNAQLR